MGNKWKLEGHFDSVWNHGAFIFQTSNRLPIDEIQSCLSDVWFCWLKAFHGSFRFQKTFSCVINHSPQLSHSCCLDAVHVVLLIPPHVHPVVSVCCAFYIMILNSWPISHLLKLIVRRVQTDISRWISFSWSIAIPCECASSSHMQAAPWTTRLTQVENPPLICTPRFALLIPLNNSILEDYFRTNASGEGKVCVVFQLFSVVSGESLADSSAETGTPLLCCSLSDYWLDF